MTRQGLLKLLQSDLSDDDVLEILRAVTCPNKGINTDMYRPTYQPWINHNPQFKVGDAVAQNV